MKSGLSESPNKSPSPTNFLVNKTLTHHSLATPLFPTSLLVPCPFPTSFWQRTSLLLITFGDQHCYCYLANNPLLPSLICKPTPPSFLVPSLFPMSFWQKTSPFLITVGHFLVKNLPQHSLANNPFLPSLICKPPPPITFDPTTHP